jgi:hypothetical protein
MFDHRREVLREKQCRKEKVYQGREYKSKMGEESERRKGTRPNQRKTFRKVRTVINHHLSPHSPFLKLISFRWG